MAVLRFDSDVCLVVGAGAATVYQNIVYWCEKNEANEENYFEGNYWTYNSQKAFSRLFRCFSERQVRGYLKKLIDEELILVGDFNKSKRERVKWYAVNPGYSQPTKASHGVTKTSDAIDQNVGCHTDIKPNIKNNNKKAVGSKKMGYAPQGAEYYKKRVADYRRMAKYEPHKVGAKAYELATEYLRQTNITDRCKRLGLANEFLCLACSVLFLPAKDGRGFVVASLDTHICSLGFAARMDEIEQAMAQ